MIRFYLSDNPFHSGLKMVSTFFLMLLLAPVLCAQPERSELLSLAEAVNRARQQQPLIVMAKQRVAMMEAERLEAGLRPNPSLTVSGENFPLDPPQDGFAFSRTMDWFVTYSQTFERGHKRELRLALAERNLENAQAEAAATERQMVHAVRIAYQQVVMERERAALLQATTDNIHQLVQLTSARVKEGYSPEGDLIKTRLEAQRYEYQLRKAAIDYEKAKIQLLKAMGASSFENQAVNFTPSEKLEYQPVAINFAALQEAAFCQPQIRVAEARVASAQALLQLEKARARPDVTATFGYKRNGVDNALYGAVNIPLPIYNRNTGMIARAEAAVTAAQEELRYQKNIVLAELTAARRSVELHELQLEKLQADFLSDANESQKISLIAYREGATDLLTLLDAQRMRGQAQELWSQALHDYQLAVHDLERAADIEKLPLKKRTTQLTPQENQQRGR
jgi:cobalt-zinc-cadmium efflux system outer membrane protein